MLDGELVHPEVGLLDGIVPAPVREVHVPRKRRVVTGGGAPSGVDGECGREASRKMAVGVPECVARDSAKRLEAANAAASLSAGSIGTQT
jgi:hypothetical protein